MHRFSIKNSLLITTRRLEAKSTSKRDDGAIRERFALTHFVYTIFVAVVVAFFVHSSTWAFVPVMYGLPIDSRPGGNCGNMRDFLAPGPPLGDNLPGE